MKKRLFGTDGIRAKAGAAPLDESTVRRFGQALGQRLGRGCRVVLGRDTRESGPWLRDAVAAGLAAAGGEAVDVGVVSTPALAWIVRHDSFDAGVMISASHNPFADNGLKVFSGDGVKLADAVECEIEALILDGGLNVATANEATLGDGAPLVEGYIQHLLGTVDGNRLNGLRVALDCANGSACELAPRIFKALGAEVLPIGIAPDGRNINLDCGSLHLDSLAAFVAEHDCDLGLAFDGDADRCLAVDRKGRTIDGDTILFITGRDLKRRGRLQGDAVVATIMSNLWLEERLRAEGVHLHRAKVGDKYVLEKMTSDDLALGGEQSGHVIFREHATTGDGVLTGLRLIDAVLESGERLDAILDSITPYPQELINVRVQDKPDLREHPVIGPKVTEIEDQLGDTGRIVLRYSGTEPLVRVMLEGKDPARIRNFTEQLAGVIEKTIGSGA